MEMKKFMGASFAVALFVSTCVSAGLLDALNVDPVVIHNLLTKGVFWTRFIWLFGAGAIVLAAIILLVKLSSDSLPRRPSKKESLTRGVFLFFLLSSCGFAFMNQAEAQYQRNLTEELKSYYQQVCSGTGEGVKTEAYEEYTRRMHRFADLNELQYTDLKPYRYMESIGVKLLYDSYDRNASCSTIADMLDFT